MLTFLLSHDVIGHGFRFKPVSLSAPQRTFEEALFLLKMLYEMANLTGF